MNSHQRKQKAAELATLECFRSVQIHTEAIRAKLREFYGCERPKKFFECGDRAGYLSCSNCGDVENLESHCSRKWCPRCQHRVVKNRVEVLREWSRTVKQPKLVTLTSRNSETIRPSTLRNLRNNVWKLRRQEVFEQVQGGCLTMEVTNEGRGWHCHAHLLVDAAWVDQRELSIAWGKLVEQDYAVVDVRDKRNKDAGAEAAKYVCKAAQFAAWQPNEIAEFVHAVSSVRMFQPFGSLFGQSKKILARIRQRKPPKVCQCGCSNFEFTPIREDFE